MHTQSRNVFRNDIVAIAATQSKIIAGRQSRNDQRSTAHNAQKCPFPSSWSHFLNWPLASCMVLLSNESAEKTCIVSCCGLNRAVRANLFHGTFPQMFAFISNHKDTHTVTRDNNTGAFLMRENLPFLRPDLACVLSLESECQHESFCAAQ